MPDTPTPKQAEVLEIVHANIGRIWTARAFAREAWPDAPGWKTYCRVGRGTARGASMPQMASGYITGMERRGLLYRRRASSNQFALVITDSGRAALARYKAKQKDKQP